MKRVIFLVFSAMLIATLACKGQAPTPTQSIPTLESSVFDTQETAYGFFPSPPKLTTKSVLAHYEDMSRLGDFVLFQHNVPWEDFKTGIDGESQARTDIRNQVLLGQQNGLDMVFVVDPLNGLNRNEFMDLPANWEASFANPDVRTAFKNYTLWVLREFKPHYLGLSSEINTYLETFPEEVSPYLSLYNEMYEMIKEEAPETQVFVTFQWENMNNAGVFAKAGHTPFEPEWEEIEMFEPNLDLWAISSYPFVVYNSGSEIPADYYTALLTRTAKPLAVAEGGFPSLASAAFGGDEDSQTYYLNAINDQLGGERLAFWTYLILNDLDMNSYAAEMGSDHPDFETLRLFASVGMREIDGTPKPALAVWNEIRNQ